MLKHLEISTFSMIRLIAALALGLVPIAAWLAVGLLSGGEPTSSSDTPLHSGLALFFGMILAIGALVITDIGGERRAGIATAPQIVDAAVPALLSQPNGRVSWANPAMLTAGGSPTGRLETVLQRVVDADGAMIYCLSKAALSVGFAFEHVFERPAGTPKYLVARLMEDRALLWTIVPSEQMREVMPAQTSDSYEDATFAHLRLGPGPAASTNAAFRERFGPDAGPVLPFLRHEDGLQSGRTILPFADGTQGLMRVTVVPYGGPDQEVWDVFFFPEVLGNDRVREPAAGLASVPVALLQLDLSGRLLWMNHHAREMLSDAVAPGLPLDLILEALGRPIALLIDDAAHGEKRPRGEMVRLAGRQNDAFVQITLTRVRLDGQDCLLGVLTDANELRQLEDKFAQSQKMEAVGKLAGGVAHDFNNVLTAVAGHCDLLMLGKDASHPDYSDLMQVKQNANRAAALVRQLLAFSRKQTLNPSLLSLPDVLSDTMYLLDRLIGERVTLSTQHGEDLGKVRADRQQLEQALMNLVVNARDAMPGGGVVRITTENVTVRETQAINGNVVGPGDYVEISVEDQGTGIDPAVIDRVFDPFFTTKPMGEGTGLGLSTVYGIVKQSGGFIFAENREEGGARFRILLPRAEEEERRPQITTDEVPRGDLTGQGAVLLVEDEAPVRAFASRALKLRGYQVTAAASAEEAMSYVSDLSHPVDLLVSDVVMPGLDGPSFAKKARELRPNLPVVFVSGYAEESFRKNMVDPDFSFLAKPFSLSELTAKVKEVLDESVGAAPAKGGKSPPSS